MNHDQEAASQYPHGRGYGHDYMRGGEVLGGYGYSKEFIVERLYRDAPLLCIGEGTNEIQRIVIAKRLIEKNKI